MIAIRRGASVNVEITFTVPFGCIYHHTWSSFVDNCVLNIAMVESDHGNCSIDIGDQNKCGLSVRRGDWKKTHNFNIIHQDEVSNDFKAFRRINLETQRLISNEIWSFVKLPTITVNIHHEL